MGLCAEWDIQFRSVSGWDVKPLSDSTWYLHNFLLYLVARETCTDSVLLRQRDSSAPIIPKGRNRRCILCETIYVGHLSDPIVSNQFQIFEGVSFAQWCQQMHVDGNAMKFFKQWTKSPAVCEWTLPDILKQCQCSLRICWVQLSHAPGPRVHVGVTRFASWNLNR